MDKKKTLLQKQEHFFMVTRTGSFAFFAFRAKNYGVAAVETGGEQQSTGLLH